MQSDLKRRTHETSESLSSLQMHKGLRRDCGKKLRDTDKSVKIIIFWYFIPLNLLDV